MNYSMYSVWDELRRFSLEKGEGEITTTLFGDVPCGWIDDELAGLVPNWLIAEAHNNGFEVVDANWKHNYYTLREINGH